MREIIQSNQFDRDIKRCSKRGLNLQELVTIVDLLVHDKPLENKYRPHPLKNNFSGWHECHIRPDWLLIYQQEGEDILRLMRTGTHADLFG